QGPPPAGPGASTPSAFGGHARGPHARATRPRPARRPRLRRHRPPHPREPLHPVPREGGTDVRAPALRRRLGRGLARRVRRAPAEGAEGAGGGRSLARPPRPSALTALGVVVRGRDRPVPETDSATASLVLDVG